MFEPWLCTGGKHLAPETGGSCPCGMVTRIPAPERLPAEPPPEVRAVLAQYLDEWSESLEAAASRVLHDLEAAASRVLHDLEAAASRLLHEQAARLAPALPATGLVLGAGDADRPVIPWIDVAQGSAPAYTAPRAAAVVTPVSEDALAPLPVRVTGAPGERDARRAEVGASGNASAPPSLLRQGGGRGHADGHEDRRARKKTGQRHRQQPSRAKRHPSAAEVIHPPACMPGDRRIGSPGIFGEHDPEALCEAV